MNPISLGLVLLGLALTGGAAAQETPSPPQVGDRAPDFSLRGTDGKTYSLEQFRGERPVVIAWFPKAFTAG